MKGGLPLSKIVLLSIFFLPYRGFTQNNFSVPVAYSYPDHGGGGGMTCNVPLNEINIHAYRHFRKLYPQVEGESWLKMQDGYIV